MAKRASGIALGLAAAAASAVAQVSRGEGPETFGPGAGYTNVAPSELQAESPGFIDLARYVGGAECLDNSSSGNLVEANAYAQIALPDGALLDQLLFWAFDQHPDHDLIFEVYESCQAYGANAPDVTLIGQGQTFLAIGTYFGFASLGNRTANTRDCVYSVRVLFTAPGQECAGALLTAQKIQIRWRRQVSPAPAAASFGDVPTAHPFFQFIEALSKSGITAGCNAAPPLYCPDAPLTRGQMAVFLSKALGLQWPLPPSE